MAIKYSLNGRTVTKEEFDAHNDPSKLQGVFASRKFPGIQDDTTFMAGRGTLDAQLGEEDANYVAGECERIHGVRPSPNAAYLPSLARHAGDIRAFVTQDGAKGHVRKVCEQEGWRCEGSVNVNPSKREEGDPGFVRPSLEDCKLTSLAKRDPIRVSN
jgi:hypothetical protein